MMNILRRNVYDGPGDMQSGQISDIQEKGTTAKGGDDRLLL